MGKWVVHVPADFSKVKHLVDVILDCEDDIEILKYQRTFKEQFQNLDEA